MPLSIRRPIARRRLLIALGAGALAAPLGALAQQPDKLRRIGFLGVRSRPTPSNPNIYIDAFVQEMGRLGYAEGKNLVIDWRFADSNHERLPGLASELVVMKPELIVTYSTPATRALQRATSTIPIVTAAMGDPVGSGIAASLGRPGGNITGLSIMTADVYPKQLELLKLMVPGLSRAAALVHPSTARSVALESLQAAAQKLGVKLVQMEVRTPEEIERGFAVMKRDRADAVFIAADPYFIGQRREIVELAARNRLPSVFSYREDVQAGGLMSYGQDLTDFYRRAATYVDKILKGAKPGELPFEQPTKIHLAINRKTAKALGITVPQQLLIRADEVIE